MDYAEAAYFDGDHCQHVAAWVDFHAYARRRRAFMEQHQRLGRALRRAPTLPVEVRDWSL